MRAFDRSPSACPLFQCPRCPPSPPGSRFGLAGEAGVNLCVVKKKTRLRLNSVEFYRVGMLLDDQDLEELKEIHRAEFNEELTDGEARAMGTRLLRLYEILANAPTKPLAPLEKSEAVATVNGKSHGASLVQV